MTGDALVGPGRNHEPDPLVRLATELRDLRRYVDDKSAQILRTAGLRAEPDLLRVLGSLVVEGDLSVPSGVINLAGIDQDVASSIAAIAALVDAQLASGAGSNVYNGAISTATTAYASVSIPVPAGFTHASVVGISHGLFSGSPLALGLRTRIDGVDGNQASIVTSAAWMSGSCSSTRASYPVSGSVTVSTVCAGAASGVTGTCITSALVLFQR